MSIINCFDRAQKLGILSADENKVLRQRYDEMKADGISDIEAKARMARQIAAEADHRERAALMTHLVVDRLMTTLANYRDYKGGVDQATALLNVHENMGDNGTFVQDAEGLREAIVRSSLADMKDVLRELKRGAFTGDLRRTVNKKVKARMDNIVREIMGVDTDDAKAKALAQAWTQTAEKLRLRFNEAGGAIGKLQGGYLPQTHDKLALLDFGKTPWVAHMMEPGRLDRARMVDQFTQQPLTDTQLRRALETAWERITTNGYYDADMTAPGGKTAGALYTQHMDHRFISFATPEHWMDYSKRFGGGGDIFAAMMGHIGVMARDIAHMETFGPNPNRTREHLKQHLRKQAAEGKPNEVVIAEQKAELLRLAKLMGRQTPEYQAAIDRHADILNEMDRLRNTRDARISLAEEVLRPDAQPGPRAEGFRQKYAALGQELLEVTRQLEEFDSGTKDKMVSDPAAEAEFKWLLANMREPIVVKTGVKTDRAQGWVEAKIRRMDAMWDVMRGGEVGDQVFAARMQSARNWISSAALGSAVLSSLTDPAFGQDARLRMGQGIVKSNFARIAIANLREMIFMGSREDAIAAGLGIDSALRVLHRQAKEVSGWDHRFWTGYMADRVLTSGMLLPWTQAGKHQFGLDMMRFMGDLSKDTWTALPDKTRQMMMRQGFDARSWEQLRAAPKQGGLLRPTDVIALDRTVGERYLQMILRETRHAVPEATVNSSSILQAQPAGTLPGEIWRSMLQFKGFGMAVLQLHALRIARELGAGEARGSAAGYAATLFITSTMLGMVAIALKDIKDGRDPRKWLDEKTWLDPFYIGEAILQAGGLGIFGDFIRASDNRMGGGLGGTIMGPIAGKIENIATVISPKQIGKAVSGKDVTSEEEAVRLLRSGTVPFSNHVLLAALYQRVLMDKLQRLADPEADKAFQRTINKRQKDYNQGYWLRPGQPLSNARLPDVKRVWSTR